MKKVFVVDGFYSQAGVGGHKRSIKDEHIVKEVLYNFR